MSATRSPEWLAAQSDYIHGRPNASAMENLLFRLAAVERMFNIESKEMAA